MGKWVDSHNKKVMHGVWPIYEALIEKTAAEIVVIERDSDFQNLTAVEDDLIRAREVFYKHRPKKRKTVEKPEFKPSRLKKCDSDQLGLYQGKGAPQAVGRRWPTSRSGSSWLVGP